MKINKLYLKIAAFILLGFAVLAMFQERLGIKVDSIVVTFVGLALFMLFLPYISTLSKLKFGDLEFEFEKKVDELEKMVVKEEVTDPSFSQHSKSNFSWEHYYKEYSDIIGSSSSNTEKILRASQLVELMIIQAGDDFELDKNVKSKNPSMVIRELYKNELISNNELALYNEFYSLRNKIIHGEIKDISDSLTTRILDLLWRIVKIFG